VRRSGDDENSDRPIPAQGFDPCRLRHWACLVGRLLLDGNKADGLNMAVATAKKVLAAIAVAGTLLNP